MPIDYKKYPENWLTEIRPRILERANNSCECCGLENYTRIISFKINGVTTWSDIIHKGQYDLKTGFKLVKVVLTIAHLDHDEKNLKVTDDRLKAMCQLCHLRYDSEEKKRRNKLKSL